MRNASTITIKNILLVNGLKHNLLNINQLCDKEYAVVFDTHSCLIEHKANNDIVFKGSSIDNVYILDLDDVKGMELSA